MAETIEALVDGGKANGGPPLGPALGPLGININDVVSAINEKTKHFVGMKVPVKVVIDEKTKAYEISVGTPPTSALILKELGIEKGSHDLGASAGNIDIPTLIKISEMKGDSLSGVDTKSRVMEITGTCVSANITIEGLPPKEFQKLIKEGKYDQKLA